MKDQFAAAFRNQLKKHYGKLPSAAAVARDFNLRAYTVEPVSQESVRKWMRGECLPKTEHVFIIASWLKLDISVLCDTGSITPSHALLGRAHSPLDT